MYSTQMFYFLRLTIQNVYANKQMFDRMLSLFICILALLCMKSQYIMHCIISIVTYSGMLSVNIVEEVNTAHLSQIKCKTHGRHSFFLTSELFCKLINMLMCQICDLHYVPFTRTEHNNLAYTQHEYKYIKLCICTCHSGGQFCSTI